ncbi:MAG: ligase-associated DNA damage response exonuclease [Saprospiraceae bacterium]
MSSSTLLTYTSKGLYCPAADVYIDPHKPVTKALITHGHSDHAIIGHRYYLCTPLTSAIIKFRLGSFIQVQSINFGESVMINNVKFSFHPAGHIPGSAQIRIEFKGEVWVVTGDYKTEIDRVSGAFELIRCNTLVTETTFALPIYQWKPQSMIIEDILTWYQDNLEAGHSSVLLAYALGKSQRIIASIPEEIPIYVHGTVDNTNDVLISAGLKLRSSIKVSSRVSKKDIQKGITIAPSSVLNTPWIRSLQEPVTATASGWMTLNRSRKKQAADFGFALSDHVDWNALIAVVKGCGADHIWLTHGYTTDFSRWLTSIGISSHCIERGNKTIDIDNLTEED